MAFEFVSSLQAQWGDENSLEHQEVNVVNLIDQLHRWLEGADLPHLGAHLEQLRSRVRGAALSVEQDLKGEAPELEALLTATWHDYQDMTELLDQLIEAHARADHSTLDPLVAQLDQASENLAVHSAELQAWLDAEIPRCPRCGATPAAPEGERSRSRVGGVNKRATCGRCQLEMLLPDNKGPGPTRTLDLPAEFKTVHDAYVAVVKGELSLSRLLPTLDPLRELLQTYADLTAARVNVGEEVQYSLQNMGTAARMGLDGISILEGVPITRQTRDLHEGWRLVFDCCALLQGQIPTLARATGEEPDQERVLQQLTFDSVHLTGEDD